MNPYLDWQIENRIYLQLLYAKSNLLQLTNLMFVADQEAAT